MLGRPYAFGRLFSRWLGVIPVGGTAGLNRFRTEHVSEDSGRCVLFESIGLPQLLCKVLAESVAGALVKTKLDFQWGNVCKMAAHVE